MLVHSVQLGIAFLARRTSSVNRGVLGKTEPGASGDQNQDAVLPSGGFKSRVLRAVAARIRFLLGAVCLLTAWSFVGGQWLAGELATHFRPHYFVALLAGALYLVLARRGAWLVPVLLCGFLNGLYVLPYYRAPLVPPAGSESSSIRLLLANVQTSNTEHELVMELVRREDPDIIALLEVDQRWLDSIAVLKGSYPYFVEEPRSDNFGIAVLSRVPLKALGLVSYGSADVPSVEGRFLLGGQEVLFVATHPVPPIGTQMFRWRNEGLRELAAVAAAAPLCVLAGDLNSTPWSPDYREFEQESGLGNARRGFGVLPTWPVALGPLGIPLDHCLVSEAIVVTSVRCGPGIGGDHRPLLVDLRLP